MGPSNFQELKITTFFLIIQKNIKKYFCQIFFLINYCLLVSYLHFLLLLKFCILYSISNKFFLLIFRMIISIVCVSKQFFRNADK